MKTKTVTPRRVKEMLHDKEELALLDVREQGAFAKEHQLLACSVPFGHMELRRGDLVPRHVTRIVVVDEGRLINCGFGKGQPNVWQVSGTPTFQSWRVVSAPGALPALNSSPA